MSSSTATTRKPWPDARRQRTRTMLIESAYRRMTKAGVEASSLHEITDGAGMGAGTIYNYFESKEDLAAQVLDCLINNLVARTVATIEALHAETALERIVISVRCGLNELLTNRIWYWWLQHPDLLVERTRRGFHEIGIADLRNAAAAHAISAPGDDIEAAWSMLIWQMVAGARDIVDGFRLRESERTISASILQAIGVTPAETFRLLRAEAPAYVELPVDFTFRFQGNAGERKGTGSSKS